MIANDVLEMYFALPEEEQAVFKVNFIYLIDFDKQMDAIEKRILEFPEIKPTKET